MPNLGGWELVLVLLVVVLVFGSKRLPDASRSLGRSLRILKAETKGLRDDDDAPDRDGVHGGYPQQGGSQANHPQQGGYAQQQSYPQQGGYPQQQSYPQQGGYPQQQSYPPVETQHGQPQGAPQPLPTSPAIPGVAPAPGSVPPADASRQG